jgi:hypothetical protein
VQQHYIAGPDPGGQLYSVRGQHLRVMTGLRRPERGSVPDQDLQHLGNPATCCGGADIPDGAPGQHLLDLAGQAKALCRPPRDLARAMKVNHGRPPVIKT